VAIIELRILPPVAIGRLGASRTPLEAFELVSSTDSPLDYRRIVPRTSFKVDETSGEIKRAYIPNKIVFKDKGANGKLEIRPVAPFLEVFAITSEAPDVLKPLTLEVLRQEGLSVGDLRWSVAVANLKVFRRTGNPDDGIHAAIDPVKGHGRQPLLGECKHFLPGRTLPLGYVQFVKPTAAYPGIRFRFTPAAGKVYGASRERHTSPTAFERDPVITSDDLVLYDKDKGWRGYWESSDPGETKPGLTNPAQIFAGYSVNARQVSWGYIDDECDGYARVSLHLADGKELSAQAVIGAGPPAFAPDTLPLRVVSDELEQILYGPTCDDCVVSLDEAAELVHRGLETVRLLNTAVMNGNPVNGRLNVASSMVRQDTNDFERYYAPIAAASLVDNLALRTLHERVFGGLAAGGAAWFAQALRRPEEIGDLSDQARRKMPAMMRGADARGLTFTRRQIDLVVKAAAKAMFGDVRTAGQDGGRNPGREQS
jgi:hypothetical protein